jgi:hypothetical protein
MKRADELEKKLEAAQKALEEAWTKAKSKEKRWEEEKSKVATREADIHQRLDALNASFISNSKYSLVAIPLSFAILSIVFFDFHMSLQQKKLGTPTRGPRTRRLIRCLTR